MGDAAEHLDDPADPRLAPYRSLRDADLARSHGLFLVEGRFAVQTLLSGSLYRPHSVVVHHAAYEALKERLDEHAARGLPVYVLRREALAALVGFDMHRGCVAAAHRPVDAGPGPLLARVREQPACRPVVVLEDLSNHDNVGGIFRSAAAFGAAGVLCSPRTADPLYRKAVRVSMAAVLRVPFGVATDWPRGLAEVAERERWAVLALSTGADAVPAEALEALAAQAVAKGKRPALLIGAEGPGLSAAAQALAVARVRIGMTDAVDSLNATVAASIALHRLAVWIR
jgi:tRNA G18 (ribose-2'-O)-methylase SpoU